MEIKELYSPIPYPQYSRFLHNIKFVGNKLRIKFDKDLLVTEQNNYATNIVNTYIVYEKFPLKVTKKCLFGATSKVKKLINLNEFILVSELHLMGRVCGVLVIILLKIL